ncbi:MAG TPA: PKD domain-containing protein [Chitinophagaceae bacterium]|nr:PKD domain-containing protein [Chitinophagaceae bacterium]
MKNQLAELKRIRSHCAVPKTARMILLWYALIILPGFSLAQINAAFTTNVTSGCTPVVVQFTDQSTGNPVGWKWNFGDGSPIVTLQNPEKIYTIPGTYTITLTVTNGVDSSEVIKTAYITVYQSPVVNFTVSRTTGCFPLPVSFTDQSTAGSGSISSWIWDFGNGDTSGVQNPSYQYHTAGSFNVTLVVTNSFGCVSAKTKTGLINVTGGVTAAFTNTDSTACNAPLAVDFTNQTTGPPTLSYLWNFGDGQTSTAPSPSHTYSATGNYSISLISTSSGGCADTLLKKGLVSIASFNSDFNIPPGCQNTPATFLNTTSPVPTSATWYFSDGVVITGINATRTITVAGNYSVKLVNTFPGGCMDSITKNFSIAASPVAAFTASDSISCRSPFAVNFTDQSSNATSWNWNFGDGLNATSQNPSHTYSTLGTFDVKLLVSNASGCLDSVTKSGFIKISQPVVSFTPLTFKGCIPLIVPFTSTSSSTDSITGYFWDFGDGSTSILKNPTHTYTTQGTYDVKLVITTAGGCKDSLISKAAVSAGSPPTVSFTAVPTTICPSTPVQFTNTSNKGNQWFWIFGDSSESSVENPLHAYSSDTGFFNVTLIVTNLGCSDSLKKTGFIHVLPPIASYSVLRDCSTPFLISFQDHSVSASGWTWSFGDGQTSTVQNPSHTYAAAGTYTVTETVSNGTCTSTDSQEYSIIHETPDFSASQTTVCHGSTFSFNATGINAANISNFYWNFGDGTVANEPVPTVTKSYSDTGTYNVTLITTDKNGCTDSVNHNSYVKITGPKAAFTTTGSLCENQTVNFLDQSTSSGAAIITWNWSYGDGQTQTLSGPPFSHTYPLPNTYTVSLKVIDQSGCADSVAVPVNVAATKAAFTIPDSLYCTGKAITFSNQSAGIGLNYQWSFGDGSSSIAQNPSHTYTLDSNFLVKLIISNGLGCFDSTTGHISVGTPLAAFNFPASYTTTCPPLIATLDNSSSYYTQAFWNFGDGSSSVLDTPTHVYNLPGTYNIKLVITSPGGCQDSAVKILTVKGPSGSFMATEPQSACGSLNVGFSAAAINTIEYSWDFGDGVVTPLSTSDSATHNYSSTGSYFPKLILEDSTGCKISYPGNVHIVIDQLAANFGLTPSVICDSGTVFFSDSSHSFSADALGQQSTYHWDFGTGNPADTANTPNPNFYYSNSGNYLPTLTVTTPYGCTQIVQKNVLVAPSSYPLINGPDSGCAGGSYVFTGGIASGTTSIQSWSWNFGNGDTSALQNPPIQRYAQSGTYSISLTVTNINGCSESSVKSFTVNADPVVNATPKPADICLGGNITLQANDGISYQWSPSISLNNPAIANPIASPVTSILYHVQVTNAAGCISNDSVQVNVTQPFSMTAGPDTTVCATHPIPLFAIGGAYNYIWSPANGLSNPDIPDPLSILDSTVTYMVIGSDSNHCFSDTAEVTVQVNPLPQVNAGPNQTVTVGSVVQLNAYASGIITAWQWNPTDYLSCTNCANPISVPKNSVTYEVTATNNFGCQDSASVTIHLICSHGVVYIPNTFTPNGDGMNDVFYPRGKGVKIVNYFRVFNRWGQLVFERDNFNINDINSGWDGTYKGQPLTPDVFTYVTEMVCDNNEVFMLKGNVTLLR